MMFSVSKNCNLSMFQFKRVVCYKLNHPVLLLTWLSFPSFKASNLNGFLRNRSYCFPENSSIYTQFMMKCMSLCSLTLNMQYHFQNRKFGKDHYATSNYRKYIYRIYIYRIDLKLMHNFTRDWKLMQNLATFYW